MLTFCKCHALRDTLNHTIDAMGSRMMRSLGIDVKRILLAMRITAAILLICSLHVTAKSVSQTITLSGKDIPLKTVFTEIEKQSGYLITYNEEMITGAKPVTLNAKDEPLLQFLDNTLHKQGLDYIIENKTIVLKRSAQQVIQKDPPIDVKGRVVDENGEPVVGASVKVKGSNIGTQTDANGAFELSGIGDNAVLEISSVGYEYLTISVNKKTSILASLKIVAQSLNEVVVNKGYYVEERRFSVSTVGKITNKEIERQPINNPILALQGRVPGLLVTQSNGYSGGAINVQIQGQNSLRTEANYPLYIVDGIPYPSRMLNTTLGGPLRAIAGESGGNPLSFINPKDIESIEVLKDADATAIYGSRAANGAILITTKKGKSGKMKLDMNVTGGWGKVTSNLSVLQTKEYLEMRREALKNDGVMNVPSSNQDLIFWDSTRSTDWQKALIGERSSYNDINASISGGSTNSQYLIGGTYHKETTVFPYPTFFSDQKYSLFINLNNSSKSGKLQMSLSAFCMADRNRLPQEDLTFRALQLPPNAPPLYDNEGELNWELNSAGGTTWTNPLAKMNDLYENKTLNIVANGSIKYQILTDLAIEARFGFNRLNTHEFFGSPLTSYRPESRPFVTRTSVFGNSIINSRIIEPQLNYRKRFAKVRIDASFGMTFQQTNNDGQTIIAEGFNSDLVLRDINSAPTVYPHPTNGTVASTYKYNAGYSRVNINLLDKYILNLTARRDGSSRFGWANRFHNFGSLGIGWIFTEEKLFKNNPSAISFGKIRTSYGTTGNDQIDDYRYIDLYSPLAVNVPYQGATALQPNNLANPYLQWEETKKFQIGIDLGFNSDRQLISATFIRNRSSNQLLDYALPGITGFSSIFRNFPATVQNKSWEITASSSNISRKNFQWTTSINLTIPENKLYDFPDLETSTYKSFLLVGEPVSIQKVFRFGGVNSETGSFQFINSKGEIVQVPDRSTDRTEIMNTLPKYYGGLSNNFRYKSWQLDFLIQYVKQTGKVYLSNFIPGSYNNGFGNQPITVLNRWTRPGDNATVQRYSQNFSTFSSLNNWQLSDQSFSDASYLRLKNVSLGWQFPKSWTKPIGLEAGKIYLLAQNLFTVTDYNSGDPETQSPTKLPTLRVVTFGINVTL